MLKFNKSLGILLLGFGIFTAQIAFAGGSSMSWKAEGKQLLASAGQTVKGALNFHLETYFSYYDIENLRLDDLRVACVGADAFSKVYLKLDDKEITHSDFVKSKNFFVASLKSKDFVIKNNSTYDFDLDLVVKDKIKTPQVAHCGIQNLALYDLKNNQQIYNTVGTDGYVFAPPDWNESAMISLGTRNNTQNLVQEFIKFLPGNDSYGEGPKYLGNGTIKAKLIGKGDPSKAEDTTLYKINIYWFDKNFKEIFPSIGSKRPTLFYLKIDDAEALKLKKKGIVTMKVRDLSFGENMEDYPKGELIYMK